MSWQMTFVPGHVRMPTSGGWYFTFVIKTNLVEVKVDWTRWRDVHTTSMPREWIKQHRMAQYTVTLVGAKQSRRCIFLIWQLLLLRRTLSFNVNQYGLQKICRAVAIITKVKIYVTMTYDWKHKIPLLGNHAKIANNDILWNNTWQSTKYYRDLMKK